MSLDSNMIENRKSSKTLRFLTYLLIICIAFENLKVATVLGAALKPSHFIFIFIIIYCVFTAKFPRKDIFAGVFFLFLPFVPMYRISDKIEFFKTYVIYFIMVMFMTYAMRTFIAEFILNYKNYLKLFLFVAVVIEILGIVQFICMNFFGIFFLKDFFGVLQFHRSQFGMQGDYFRAYSLFYEPSFFAIVILASLTVKLFLVSNKVLKKSHRFILIGLDLIALVCSLSSAGLFICIALFFVYSLTLSKNAAKVCFSFLFFIVAALAIWEYTDLFEPLKRIDEINNPGTSGYERLVTPFLYVKETFANFPFFGRGLGQEGDVDIIGTIGRYSGIHNSLIGIISNFGLSVLCFYIPFIVYSIRKVKQNKIWFLILIAILGMYVSTGAIFTPDTFIIFVLLISFGNENILNEITKGEA